MNTCCVAAICNYEHDRSHSVSDITFIFIVLIAIINASSACLKQFTLSEPQLFSSVKWVS